MLVIAIAIIVAGLLVKSRRPPEALPVEERIQTVRVIGIAYPPHYWRRLCPSVEHAE